MSLAVAQGSLTFVFNGAGAQVFYNGSEVTGVTGIDVEWSATEQEFKLRVNGDDDADYMALISAGIAVKKEKKQ